LKDGKRLPALVQKGKLVLIERTIYVLCRERNGKSSHKTKKAE
jgi:hypothetical protein